MNNQEISQSYTSKNQIAKLCFYFFQLFLKSEIYLNFAVSNIQILFNGLHKV